MLIKPYHNSFSAALIVFFIIFLEILLGLGSTVLPAYIPFTGMLLVILFIVLCVRLHWGLYLLFFAIFLDIGRFIFYSNYAPQSMLETNCALRSFYALVMVILMAWLVRTGSKVGDKGHYLMQNQKPTLDPIALLLGLFVGWNALSLFWTPNLVIGIMQFVKLLVNIGIFCFFYYFIVSSNALRRVGWAGLLTGVVLTIASIYSIYGFDFRAEFTKEFWAGKTEANVWSFVYPISDSIDFAAQWKIHRSRGTAFMHPAELAFTMNFLLAIGAGLLLSTKKEKRTERFILTVVLLLLLSSHFTTLSRAGTVSLLVMIFFFLVFFHRLREKIIKNSLIVIFTLTILFVLVQNERIYDVAIKRLSSTGQELSMEERLMWWETALTEFRKTSGVGCGIGASYFYVRPSPHVHNIYISILADMGWVGFLLFSIFIVMILNGALPIIKYQKTFPQYLLLASCGGMLALSAQGLLDFHYNLTKMWLFMGISMAALRLAKQELAQEGAADLQLAGKLGVSGAR